MADGGSKGGTFAKVFQKRVGRTKEKVLQNLGKADRTTDDLFDDHVNNIQKQQNAGAKLEKELKNYITCVRNMSVASKTFYDTLKETYEVEWTGYTELVNAVESLSMLWDDYNMKLQEQVHNPLITYRSQFPEVRAKISKRGRKLVDYDSARHNLQALESAKKPDDNKIAKAREELQDGKKIYEEFNNELHEELPALYDNRVSFLSSNYYSLFSTEAKFQEECAKLKNQLADVTEKLQKESSQGAFTTPRGVTINRKQDGEDKMGMGDGENKGLTVFYDINMSNDTDSHGSGSEHNRTTNIVGTEGVTDLSMQENHQRSSAANGEVSDEKEGQKLEEKSGEKSDEKSDEKSEELAAPDPSEDYEPVNVKVQMDKSEEGATGSSLYMEAGDTDDIYKIPQSNAPLDNKLPPGVIYRVEATHPYAGEDTDELTFEAGDLINVIPFEDPDEQDEGWLLGIRSTGGERGVFPANFTRRI